MQRSRAALLALLLIAGEGEMAEARPVAVVGTEMGQAFLVNHQGNCYALLPAHVIGPYASSFTVATALPEQIGAATPVGPRYLKVEDADGNVGGMDLALAVIRGDAIEKDCGLAWAKLPRNLDRQLRDGRTATLVRVARGQQVRNTAVRIGRVDYETFDMEPVSTEPADAIAKGTSGSVVVTDDGPVGLVLTTSGERGAEVLRMDAIVSRLDRFVAGRAGVLPAPPEPSAAKFRLVDFAPPPLSPDAGPDDILETEPRTAYVAEAGGAVTLVLAANGGDAVPLHRVVMTTKASPKDAGTVTMPKDVEVWVDSSQTGARPRRFSAGAMGPDGRYEVSYGVATRVRRVTIKVNSSWHPGRPIRIDHIVLE